MPILTRWAGRKGSGASVVSVTVRGSTTVTSVTLATRKDGPWLIAWSAGEGCLDVIGGEGVAGVEGDALAQGEGVGRPILGDLPAFGEGRNQLQGSGIDLDQRLIDVAGDGEAAGVLDQGGVD